MGEKPTEIDRSFTRKMHAVIEGPQLRSYHPLSKFFSRYPDVGSVAEWLACWTQTQKGPGSNRSRDAVG